MATGKIDEREIRFGHCESDKNSGLGFPSLESDFKVIINYNLLIPDSVLSD
jgi:hypothetical protein